MDKKLLKIQGELKAPKGQNNDFGHYKYRSCEDILEAVKPLLIKNDCTLTLKDDVIAVLDRIYIRATATFTGDEVLNITALAREPIDKKGMDSSQITGTASSYARKYALNGLFLIDDTKDADTNEYKKQTDVKSTVKPVERTKEEILSQKPTDIITEGGADFLLNMCLEVGSDVKEVCKYFKVNNFTEMTVDQFNKAKEIFERKVKK